VFPEAGCWGVAPKRPPPVDGAAPPKSVEAELPEAGAEDCAVDVFENRPPDFWLKRDWPCAGAFPCGGGPAGVVDGNRELVPD
jgi:hypothetical protein